MANVNRYFLKKEKKSKKGLKKRQGKKLLLNHFGSIKNIKTASSQDIMKVKGISRLLSEKIYAYFND
jgi:excinuclease UvrABC nuclease subunit